jgi:hypothetical protein
MFFHFWLMFFFCECVCVLLCVLASDSLACRPSHLVCHWRHADIVPFQDGDLCRVVGEAQVARRVLPETAARTTDLPVSARLMWQAMASLWVGRGVWHFIAEVLTWLRQTLLGEQLRESYLSVLVSIGEHKKKRLWIIDYEVLLPIQIASLVEFVFWLLDVAGETSECKTA